MFDFGIVDVDPICGETIKTRIKVVIGWFVTFRGGITIMLPSIEPYFTKQMSRSDLDANDPRY